MKLNGLIVLACSLVLCGNAFAGSAYSLTAGSGEGGPGSDVDISVVLDSSAGGDVQGWSYGLCGSEPSVVVDGATTAVVAGGSPPDFDQVTTYPGGFTVGVVISFLGSFILNPGTDQELNVATFTAPAAGTCDPLDFCDTLGTPAVATVIVSSGSSITPSQNSGEVCGAEVPEYAYTIGAPGSGAGPTVVHFGIADLNPAGNNDTQGFSMGMSHSGTATATIDVATIVPTGDLASIGGGAGPDFFGSSAYTNGWTVGVVHAFLGGVFIDYTTPQDVIDVTYDIAGAEGDSLTIQCDGTLGEPPVANVVVVNGASIPVGECVAQTIDIFVAPPEPLFIRGDCNGDGGVVNIADGIWLLNQLFFAGPDNGCDNACDANNDDIVDSADATYIFNWRFLGGPAPSAPFPDCGTDGEDDCAYTCP